MKDKIVFFILGMLVITAVIITERVNSPVAQVDTQVFENVLIRGKLIIEDGDNRITLENKDGASNIIIDSKGCGIALSAKEDNATVLVINDIQDKGKLGIPKGIALYTTRDQATNEKGSLIYMQDDKGMKISTTTD